MRPIFRFLFPAVLLVFGVTCSHAQTATDRIRTVQVRDLGTRVLTLGLEARKPGQPVVIFENGAGSTIASWSEVTPAVAKFAPVIAYNRPGIGGSAPDKQPPTIAAMNAHLAALLAELDVDPPYVLVGHSWGGPLIHYFAGTHASDVAGLVYVDHTDFTQPDFPDPAFEAIGIDTTRQRILFAEFEAEMETSFAAAPPAIRAEFDVIDKFMKRDVADRGLPAKPTCPVAVILGGRMGPPPPQSTSVAVDFKALAAAQLHNRIRNVQHLIADNPNATMVVANHAQHYVQRDDPALVIEAIHRVLFPPALPFLKHRITTQGLAAAVAEYHRMRERYPAGTFNERVLNALGYEFLNENDTKTAVAIFELNVAEYPDASNPYDSLGEGYMRDGDRQKAIENYRKSLDLDPQNTNAVRMLEQLESE